MTYRSTDSSCKSCYSQPQSRLNQQIKSARKDEGCPVLEESGSVCGETESLNVFLDFKKIYDDCLRKLERTPDGKTTLKKLAPFQRLIDHLWEQNAMLIETVEELEEEATCKLSTLQDRLNKSCQKICDYQDDINSLVTIIHRFCEKGVLDPEGVEFKTLCPSYIYGPCENSCTEYEGTDHPEVSSRSESKCSINSDNFDTNDKLECDSSTNNSFKPCRQLLRKITENRVSSGSLRSKSYCSENRSFAQSEPIQLGAGPKKNCRCCSQNKESKSVTWLPEKCSECPGHSENSDSHSSDCSLSFK